MNPNWTCPKCKSREALYVPGKEGGHGGVETSRFLFGNLQPSRVICGGCGFVEEYFDDPKHLELLRRKYTGSAAKKRSKK